MKALSVHRFLLIGVLYLAGCGDSFGPPLKVTGKVTLDDKPLADANITFHSVAPGLPADKRTVTAKTDAAGLYVMNAVYPGEYQVGVEKGEKVDPAKMQAIPPPNPLSNYALGVSTLKATIAKDKPTNFDFLLTGAPAP